MNKLLNFEKYVDRIRSACKDAFVNQKFDIPKVPLIKEGYEIYRLEKPLTKFTEEELEKLVKLIGEITPDEYGIVDSYIKELGIEALAWYRPFHYLPMDLWGIYITLYGLRYLVSQIKKFFLHQKSIDALKSAFDILWHHELFHSLVELFALRCELISLQPKYIPYYLAIYKKQYPNCIEEALANRYVLSRKRLRSVHPYIVAFFDRQPGYYRKYKDYLGPKFKNGREELCNLIVFLSNKGLPIDDLHPPEGFSVIDIPTYLVAIRRKSEIPGVLSLIVKGDRLYRYLKRKGCPLVRQRGSHAIFNVRGRLVSIPIHGDKEVHHKTVKDILEALNITREELINEL